MTVENSKGIDLKEFSVVLKHTLSVPDDPIQIIVNQIYNAHEGSTNIRELERCFHSVRTLTDTIALE